VVWVSGGSLAGGAADAGGLLGGLVARVAQQVVWPGRDPHREVTGVVPAGLRAVQPVQEFVGEPFGVRPGGWQRPLRGLGEAHLAATPDCDRVRNGYGLAGSDSAVSGIMRMAPVSSALAGVSALARRGGAAAGAGPGRRGGRTRTLVPGTR